MTRFRRRLVWQIIPDRVTHNLFHHPPSALGILRSLEDDAKARLHLVVKQVETIARSLREIHLLDVGREGSWIVCRRS